MKKKLIAVAIATAFAAPAFADNSNIEFYGKAFIDLETVKSSNVNSVAVPVSNSINRVSSNASRLGLKGKEDLGDGLNAIYQYEVEVDLSGNAGNGWGKTRNSMLGMNGGFGTVFLGLYDTPYKVAHNKIELFDNTTFGSAINVLGRINTVAAGTAGAAASYNFNDRRKNSLQYWSPNMEGFQVKFGYSTDVSSTATIGPTQGTKQDMLNLSATYENDMFYAAYAYANYNDLNAASSTARVATDKMTGNRLVGAVKFGDAMVGATYERLNSSSVTAASNGARTAWELVGTYKIGASNLGLSYVNAGNFGSPSTGANGAKQISLRYGYKFSKRTELYGMYSSLKNDVNGKYNFDGGTAIAGSQAGAKLDGFGVGMIHTF